MKKVTLLCSILLAATATVASAAGVEMRWGATCLQDGGTIDKTFACNSNTGTNELTCSFVLGEDILQSSGQEVVIDLAAAGSTLPAWWSLKNTGTCRLTSLSMGTTANPASVLCVDWASGGATGGIGAYNIGQRGTNTSRIKIAIAVPLALLADLTAGTEYYSCNILINNAKTVGTGACAGCNVPVCIVFNSIKCTTNSAGGVDDRTISGPANGTDADYVTWQGGAGVTVPPGTWGAGGSGCPQATPTKNATWGQVKALYH